MNTKRSRTVSRGRGGSEDESPSFQIKNGEIVIVGDTNSSEGEKQHYYIRLDQEGVVPPPFDRSLIGKVEDNEQHGGVRRTASRKKKTAHKKRQGASRKGSTRYINIPSSIGIALDSVKAAGLKSTFYDKLYQEKKTREEKLLTNAETTEDSQSPSLSSETCERALAKVRKSRSGPFYLNHLSLYVKSLENGPNQRDHRLNAGGCVSLKSRSPSHSKMEGDTTLLESDNIYRLVQRSRNSKPRDLPITNDKSSSTGIFYKAKSKKMRLQSRWSTPDSILSSHSSYTDSPKIVNAAQDWVECDAHCAANDAQQAANKFTEGDDAAEEQELEDARNKAIREATGLDFKSLKIKLDFLLRNNSETRENKLARSASNQKSQELETSIPLQVANVLRPQPTAAINNQISKRNKKAYRKSPQRQRKQADSQTLAKSPKKHVAFAVLRSPLEFSNNRSDTGDNVEYDDKPRISQASEPDNRGLHSASVSLSVSQRHVAKELSVVSEISGASENRSSSTRSASFQAAGVQINPVERSKGKYLTAPGRREHTHMINRYPLKISPTKDAEVTGKVKCKKKPLKTSSDNSLQTKPENMNMASILSPKNKVKRCEFYLKTSPQRVIRHMSSLEGKIANTVEMATTPDRRNKMPLHRHSSYNEKEQRSRAATKRNESGQRDCQVSASFRKVSDTPRRRILSLERNKPIQSCSPKLPTDTTERVKSGAHARSTHSENVHGVLTGPPKDSVHPKESFAAVSTKSKSVDNLPCPEVTGASPGNISPALERNAKPKLCRIQRRTSDSICLKPYKFKRFVRNRLSDIVGQKRKSPAISPVKSELRDKKGSSLMAQLTAKLNIRRRTSDTSSFATPYFRGLGRKSLSEIPKGKKKPSAVEMDSKSIKSSPLAVESKDKSPRGHDAHKADMDTEAVKSAVHQRLYGSVSSQSISGSASSHVKGFQKYKALTRGSFSDKDVTETTHGGKGGTGKWKGYFSLTKLDSAVEVIAENSRQPSRLSDTLTTVNEVSFEFAGEEQRALPSERFTTHDKSLLSPPGNNNKTGSKLTGFYRHRRQGVDSSNKEDNASQKNTYMDMLFSEVIPKVKHLQKKELADETDLSSSVDPAWIPKSNTNPSDSYFVQTSIVKPEVYGVSEMLSDLRKVQTVAGRAGALHDKQVSTGIKHDKTPSRDDPKSKTDQSKPKPSRIMSTNKTGTIEDYKKTARTSLKNAKLKTGTVPIRPLATHAQKSLGEPRSSKSRSLREPSSGTVTKSAAKLWEPLNAAKNSAALRIKDSAVKSPAHERVVRTNVRQTHLSKMAAAKRQADKHNGPATKAPQQLKVKSDPRSNKTPLPAKPHVILLMNRVSRTNSTQQTLQKQPPKEGEQSVELEDIYTEPPSEAARRQKLAYMNYVKTGTRLVFPENTIQVIKYMKQLGADDVDLYEETLPIPRSGKRPLKQKSPTPDDGGEGSVGDKDKKKPSGKEAGDIGLGSYSAAESKRNTLVRQKNTKAPKSFEGKWLRAKTSTVPEDSKTRHDTALKPILGLSSLGLTKSGTSPAHAKKGGLVSRLTEKGVTAKRSDRASGQQGRPSRCAKSEADIIAATQNRKRVVRTITSTKICVVKCRKKSSFKVKEDTAHNGNSQVDTGTKSVGRHGNPPITRRRSLRKRLRKPRGELTLVKGRCDSAKKGSLACSGSEANKNVLAVGFEENIIKLADNLLKPGQKFLNLAYDSFMNLVHFKRDSRARITEPSTLPPERCGLKKKRVIRKTKTRAKKQRSAARSPTLAACSRPDISGPEVKQQPSDDHSRTPECVPSSCVDGPCPPVEVEVNSALAMSSQENLQSFEHRK